MAKHRLFRVIAWKQSYVKRSYFAQEYVNIVHAFSGKKSILTKPAISLIQSHISQEISIEQPCVGLASLPQLL